MIFVTRPKLAWVDPLKRQFPSSDHCERPSSTRASSGARWRRSFRALVVLLLMASAAPRARAEPETPETSASVDDRLQRGVELRKQGRDAEALEEFREAYKSDRSFRIRAQIALAEQALGHWLEAERGLVLVLATEYDPWVEERRKALQEALGRVRSHLGWLIAESNVAGAELRVDGVKVAILPTAEPVRIVAGTHTLEVTAEGATPVSRTVEIRGDARTRETFELAVRPPATKEKPDAPAATEQAKTARSPSLSTGTVVAASAFGALVLTGTAALIVREINVSKYNDASECVVGTLSREERCGSYRDAANTAEYVAIGAFAGATLAGIGAGILFANDVMKSRRETASLRCGPLGWGVVCAGAF